MSNLSKKILSDPVNKWVFSNAKTKIFLVGGYVRDLLRGEISKDKDYVLKTNVKEIAIKTAKRFNSTFITLKEEHVYRVVLKNKHFIDFTSLDKTIYENLRQRDFTVNAIAWSPETDIFDPFGGLNDLNNKLIKTVNPKNLEDDPLRVLRAYRLSAKMGYTIEKNTKKYLRQYAHDIVKVASERITEELFKILNNKDAGYYLSACYKNNVLEKIIKICHKRLRKNLKLLTKFDVFLNEFKTKIDKSIINYKIAQFLDAEISQGLSRAGLIRLALLLRQAQDLINQEKPLRISRMTKKALRDIHKGYAMSKGKITDKKLYEIFKASANSIFEIAIILSMTKEKDSKKFLKRADEFIKTKKKNFLTGNEIQKILKIQPGVIIGEILSLLHENRFLGIINTKTEARAWIISNFT